MVSAESKHGTCPAVEGSDPFPQAQQRAESLGGCEAKVAGEALMPVARSFLRVHFLRLVESDISKKKKGPSWGVARFDEAYLV